jgi:hypothetical protein
MNGSISFETIWGLAVWSTCVTAGDILANKNPFDDANVFKKIDQAFADIYDANENN